MYSQFSGLKEYALANPSLNYEPWPTVVHSKTSDVSGTNGNYDDRGTQDEFYDAMAAASSSSSEDDSDNDKEVGNKVVLF